MPRSRSRSRSKSRSRSGSRERDGSRERAQGRPRGRSPKRDRSNSPKRERSQSPKREKSPSPERALSPAEDQAESSRVRVKPAESVRVIKPPPERSEFNWDFADRFRALLEDRLRWLTRSPGRRPGTLTGEVRPPDADSDEDKPNVRDLEHPIDSIDLMREANGLAHNTDQYETLNLVVRRGQPFKVKVNLNRPLLPEESLVIKLWTCIDDEPAMGPKDTKVTLKAPNADPDPREWAYTVDSQEADGVLLSITSPRNAIVCRWRLQARVLNQDSIVHKFNADKQIFIIFNAWNKEDDAYMASEEEKEEYIMNEEGIIFVGTVGYVYRGRGSREWDFGQFESPVLEAAMRLLDKSQMKPSARRSPVLISRCISAMVNINETNGVLVGNWSGDYSGGTSPTTWTGSVAILEQYMHTNKPVSYGQCWVFSGVVTSLMRALGIACRSVTNFDSAHDTDENMIHDVIFDENLDRIDHSDSVWNFHVWNEVFIRRPDLPIGYSGWQAIDGTPQELSDGIHQLGPTSLQAVREGAVYLPYDAQFVFAEVNADEVHWQNTRGGQWKVINIIDDKVGSAVLTKAVGQDWGVRAIQDVTNLYKPKDGSKEERLQVRHAVTHGNEPLVYRDLEKGVRNDVGILVEAPDFVDLIADHFTVSIGMKSLEVESHGEARTVEGKVVVKKVQYTGVLKNILLQDTFEVALPAEAPGTGKKEMNVKLTGELQSANDDSALKINIVLHVKETGQIIPYFVNIPLKLPDVIVQVDDETPRRGQTVEVTLKIPNPFNIRLTMAYFELAGAGLEKPKTLNIGTVEPNQIAGTSTFVVPKRFGKRVLHATFACRQFQGSRGSKQIQVN